LAARLNAITTRPQVHPIVERIGIVLAARVDLVLADHERTGLAQRDDPAVLAGPGFARAFEPERAFGGRDPGYDEKTKWV